METSPPTVHLVDDDESIRTALTRLLEAGGHRVHAYASATEFLLALPIDGPGCLLLDVRMPGASGIELQAALARQGHVMPIVFLTGHGSIEMGVEAMKTGAVDFLTKPVAPKVLLEAVAAALSRDSERRERAESNLHWRERQATLSAREREVMAMVVDGHLNKQIARRLGIAERTVKAHRASMMEKMGVGSLAELVRAAEQLAVPAVRTG